MAATVARMTAKQLSEIIEASVERKLLEIIGDPDADLSIRADLRRRLIRQRKAAKLGDKGIPLDELTRRLGL